MRKKNFKLRIGLLVVIAILFGTIVDGFTNIQAATKKNSSDIKALQAIIKQQKKAGADIEENINDERYIWKNGRLVEIRWYTMNLVGTLKISNLPELKVLWCDYNELTKLDVSECKNLTELICYGNYFTELDVSKCTKLKELYCYSCNLKKLDVSKCKNLTDLECQDNKITKLDMSKCKKIKSIVCDKKVKVTGCKKEIITFLK